MQGSFKKESSKILVRAYVWLESSKAVCPECGYDYAKINYTELAANSKHANIPEKKWAELKGAEPVIDWMLEFLPTQMYVSSITKERLNQPYEVECLNCGKTVIYDPSKDILLKI